MARWRAALGVLLLLSASATLVHILAADLLFPLLRPGQGVRLLVRVQESGGKAERLDVAAGSTAAAAAGGGGLGTVDLLAGGTAAGGGEAAAESMQIVASSRSSSSGSSFEPDPWSPRARPLRRGRMMGEVAPGGEQPPWGQAEAALWVPPSAVAAWQCEDGPPGGEGEQGDSYTGGLLVKSKHWVREFGGRVPRHKWCRGERPWLVPQLRRAALLRSTKARPEQGVSIVTQLSLERLGMLEAQCRLWPNQIAAVLYVPLLYGRVFSDEDAAWNSSSLDLGIAQALRFHAAMETEGSCVLDLELVVEERCSADRAMLYPANALRNRALRLAQTEAVLLLDVDFAVSSTLPALLSDPGRYEELLAMLRRQFAVVLPAFEPRDQGPAGRQLALDCVALGKECVAQAFSHGAMVGFHMEHYPRGHRATNFTLWAETSSFYNITYQQGFEPYILMARQFVPWYDERFRGYYWNKVQQLMHVATQLHIPFAVHPSAFVVHLPHRQAGTKSLTQKSGQKKRNQRMYQAAIAEMRKGIFVPVTSFPMECIQRTRW